MMMHPLSLSCVFLIQQGTFALRVAYPPVSEEKEHGAGVAAAEDAVSESLGGASSISLGAGPQEVAPGTPLSQTFPPDHHEQDLQKEREEENEHDLQHSAPVPEPSSASAGAAGARFLLRQVPHRPRPGPEHAAQGHAWDTVSSNPTFFSDPGSSTAGDNLTSTAADNSSAEQPEGASTSILASSSSSSGSVAPLGGESASASAMSPGGSTTVAAPVQMQICGLDEDEKNEHDQGISDEEKEDIINNVLVPKFKELFRATPSQLFSSLADLERERDRRQKDLEKSGQRLVVRNTFLELIPSLDESEEDGEEEDGAAVDVGDEQGQQGQGAHDIVMPKDKHKLFQPKTRSLSVGHSPRRRAGQAKEAAASKKLLHKNRRVDHFQSEVGQQEHLHQQEDAEPCDKSGIWTPEPEDDETIRKFSPEAMSWSTQPPRPADAVDVEEASQVEQHQGETQSLEGQPGDSPARVHTSAYFNALKCQNLLTELFVHHENDEDHEERHDDDRDARGRGEVTSEHSTSPRVKGDEEKDQVVVQGDAGNTINTSTRGSSSGSKEAAHHPQHQGATLLEKTRSSNVLAGEKQLLPLNYGSPPLWVLDSDGAVTPSQVTPPPGAWNLGCYPYPYNYMPQTQHVDMRQDQYQWTAMHMSSCYDYIASLSSTSAPSSGTGAAAGGAAASSSGGAAIGQEGTPFPEAGTSAGSAALGGFPFPVLMQYHANASSATAAAMSYYYSACCCSPAAPAQPQGPQQGCNVQQDADQEGGQHQAQPSTSSGRSSTKVCGPEELHPQYITGTSMITRPRPAPVRGSSDTRPRATRWLGRRGRAPMSYADLETKLLEQASRESKKKRGAMWLALTEVRSRVLRGEGDSTYCTKGRSAAGPQEGQQDHENKAMGLGDGVHSSSDHVVDHLVDTRGIFDDPLDVKGRTNKEKRKQQRSTLLGMSQNQRQRTQEILKQQKLLREYEAPGFSDDDDLNSQMDIFDDGASVISGVSSKRKANGDGPSTTKCCRAPTTLFIPYLPPHMNQLNFAQFLSDMITPHFSMVYIPTFRSGVDDDKMPRGGVKTDRDIKPWYYDYSPPAEYEDEDGQSIRSGAEGVSSHHVWEPRKWHKGYAFVNFLTHADYLHALKLLRNDWSFFGVTFPARLQTSSDRTATLSGNLLKNRYRMPKAASEQGIGMYASNHRMQRLRHMAVSGTGHSFAEYWGEPIFFLPDGTQIDGDLISQALSTCRTTIIQEGPLILNNMPEGDREGHQALCSGQEEHGYQHWTQDRSGKHCYDYYPHPQRAHAQEGHLQGEGGQQGEGQLQGEEGQLQGEGGQQGEGQAVRQRQGPGGQGPQGIAAPVLRELPHLRNIKGIRKEVDEIVRQNFTNFTSGADLGVLATGTETWTPSSDSSSSPGHRKFLPATTGGRGQQHVEGDRPEEGGHFHPTKKLSDLEVPSGVDVRGRKGRQLRYWSKRSSAVSPKSTGGEDHHADCVMLS
ncbi:unnamed protein product [Amoebophrya sp. A25]|nr:unnamed protein product [Amoebophrya sp. A25]|eukprot:GSA25T00014426001.1